MGMSVVREVNETALGRDAISDLLDEGIAHAVTYVSNWSPFYRSRFASAGIRPTDVRGVADLANVPFTTPSVEEVSGAFRRDRRTLFVLTRVR